MKKRLPITAFLIALALFFSFLSCNQRPNDNRFKHEKEEGISSKMLPHEWMYAQRAYPNNKFNKEAIHEAHRITKEARVIAANRSNGEWESAGPNNVGGRITDIALHPTNEVKIIYVGTTGGGVYKTTDGGAEWEVVFEEEGAMSIGNIAIAPSAPKTVYVGTGEANGEGISGAFYGNGVYKSTNGGDTWEFKGLENSHQIGRIVVDPENPNRVFVAAAGILYDKNEERGLYRTLDGGDNWERVLFISDSTACIDVVMNPLNPSILYAVTWERIRMPWGRKYGGVTSRIYRSLDGGEAWEQLTNGLPADSPEIGRISLAMSPSEPNVLYASYTSHPVFNFFDGVYKSSNGGTTWGRVDESQIGWIYDTFGWFFGNLRVHPTNSEDVSLLGLFLLRSLDGGKLWQDATFDMHVDFHAVEFHPQDPDFIVAGNDGGVYISQNGGFDWEKSTGIPNNLFYNCEIDQLQPERIYGGTQDQGVQRTVSGAIDDYEEILGGDGFHVIVDPDSNNFVYAEKQFGILFRSDDGGDNMECIFNCDPSNYPQLRNNFNTPLAMHPSDPTVIYYGAQHLYKGVDRGNEFFPISDDLTNGPHPQGSLSYGTISTIGLASSDPNVIYVGTDDGNVHVTFNGGDSWENISDGVPDRYVTAIAVHPSDATTAYLTVSGYREVDYQPHILGTFDGGENWGDVSSNLPEIPINDLIIHPQLPKLMFIANDMGVWYSNNAGAEWDIVGINMPFTVVNDLDLHVEEQMLLAATYGRSMLKFDITQLELVPTKEELGIQRTMEIYPNPASQFATLAIEFPWPVLGDIQLVSINGSVVKTIDNQHFTKGINERSIDLSDLTIGQYLIRVKTEKGVFSGKFIKG